MSLKRDVFRFSYMHITAQESMQSWTIASARIRVYVEYHQTVKRVQETLYKKTVDDMNSNCRWCNVQFETKTD